MIDKLGERQEGVKRYRGRANDRQIDREGDKEQEKSEWKKKTETERNREYREERDRNDKLGIDLPLINENN